MKEVNTIKVTSRSLPQTTNMSAARFPRMPVALLLAIVAVALFSISAQAQNPPFADGTYCTYRKGYFSNNIEAAQRIQSSPPFSTALVGATVFTVGDATGFTYVWKKTGTNVDIKPGPGVVLIDTGIVALRDALGTGGMPGPLSSNMTNATNMGTGGTLATQTMALTLNLNFSDAMLTPVGFGVLSLTNMETLTLDGVLLTPAQASALNGKAVVQVRDAANLALGTGVLPYGLSFGQLTELIDLLNNSFVECHATAFAQNHLYQPYITSNAFAGRRLVGNSFAPRGPNGVFSSDTGYGPVVSVGRGCPAGSISAGSPEDPYLDPTGNPVDPADKIALIERGACRFDNKIARAVLAGATAVIIFNNASGGEGLVFMGGNNPVTLPSGAVVTITIPAAFVQRSTGLFLRGGTAPVTAFVQQ